MIVRGKATTVIGRPQSKKIVERQTKPRYRPIPNPTLRLLVVHHRARIDFEAHMEDRAWLKH